MHMCMFEKFRIYQTVGVFSALREVLSHIGEIKSKHFKPWLVMMTLYEFND